MPIKIVISEAAYADLDEIFSYISGQLASPVAAGRLIDKIFDSIACLNDSPLMGFAPNNDALAARGYRLLPVNNFIVFYIPEDEEVHIIHIIYGRRDWETILLENN